MACRKQIHPAYSDQEGGVGLGLDTLSLLTPCTPGTCCWTRSVEQREGGKRLISQSVRADCRDTEQAEKESQRIQDPEGGQGDRARAEETGEEMGSGGSPRPQTV